MSATAEGVPLADHHRPVHRALVDAVLATGPVPAVPELAARLGTSPEEVRESLRTLAAADYLAVDASGRVACLYPFSATPTTHAALAEGRRRFAMCAIDALGVPAMLGRELDPEGRCAVCDMSIALRERPGAVAGAHTLSLEEVLTHAEEIFGDLLADAIPTRRPRGRHWGKDRDARDAR
jgi:hypothetical protein